MGAGQAADALREDQRGYEFDAQQDTGKLRLARDDVVLGSAGLHPPARRLGLLLAEASPLLQRAARAALPLRRDGADRRELQPQDAAPRRRDLDDRRRRRRWFRALLPVG